MFRKGKWLSTPGMKYEVRTANGVVSVHRLLAKAMESCRKHSHRGAAHVVRLSDGAAREWDGPWVDQHGKSRPNPPKPRTRAQAEYRAGQAARRSKYRASSFQEQVWGDPSLKPDFPPRLSVSERRLTGKTAQEMRDSAREAREWAGINHPGVWEGMPPKQKRYAMQSVALGSYTALRRAERLERAAARKARKAARKAPNPRRKRATRRSR